MFRIEGQPKKYEFADKIIKDWDLEVYDYLPTQISLMNKENKIDAIMLRSFGQNGWAYVASELHSGNGGCVLRDFVSAPIIPFYDYKWDLTFIGNKSCDEDPILGKTPIKKGASRVGNTILYCPIRKWTNKDIWAYTERYNVPYNDRRYDKSNGYKEFKDKTYNENYHFCCTDCVNPNKDEMVMCPLLGKEIKNIGNNMKYEENLDFYKGIMPYIDFKENYHG